jgi:hypothetical protein
MSEALAWLNSQKDLLWWLLAFSAVMGIATLIACPWWALRLPTDYFCRHHAPSPSDAPRTLASILLNVGRNMLGLMFTIAGLLMLVLPGQGLLCLLVGIMLMDVPGKHRVAQWIFARGPLLRTINWIRAKGGKPPLITPDHYTHGD